MHFNLKWVKLNLTCQKIRYLNKNLDNFRQPKIIFELNSESIDGKRSAYVMTTSFDVSSRFIFFMFYLWT